MGERKKSIDTLKPNILRVLSFTVAIFVAVFFWAPTTVEAATISLSPSSGSYSVGQSFAVSVYVGSADQAMNATDGVISFPADLLEVSSVSKSGSILSLWVQEPSFSNTSGRVNFEGIVFNPGYTGKAGKIITVNFRAKAAGTASVSFSSGSVLANDGSGTNILTGLGRATFTIGGQKQPDDKPVTPTGPLPPLPEAPSVTSPTHPDPEKWYNNNDPRFDWTLGDNTTNVNVHVDQEASTNPSTGKADGKINTVSYVDTADGVWYFHVQLQNARGWGPATHYRYQIDTQGPQSFYITELPRTTTTDPIARFIFTAEDKLSGVDTYEVAIDTGEPYMWKDDGSHVFVAPVLGPGVHVLRAKAFDRAGNSLEKFVAFEISPSAQLSFLGDGVVTVIKEVPVYRSFLFTDDIVILVGVIILFILIVLLLLLLILYLWHKYRYFRRHLHESPESVIELEHNLRKIFTILRAKVEEYSLLVEKTKVEKKLADQELSGDEDRILNDFKDYIDRAEQMMKKHFRK
ncbi:MAG TPA: cohesin domain-containing protein [Candidatus Magasanikbacteria bacterium]|nr:cohesin domain-containing protein [Candidatus Magasanikbacteria bacterium]